MFYRHRCDRVEPGSDMRKMARNMFCIIFYLCGTLFHLVLENYGTS